MRFFARGARWLFVTLGVIALTTLSIDATDALRGTQSALGILTREATIGSCPLGMAEVEYSDRTRFCIDLYEASAASQCSTLVPVSNIETVVNVNDPTCVPVPAEGSWPWVHVAYHQAEQLCARVGKRLPTAEEWYLAALGTPDSPAACTTSGALARTGALATCVSGTGNFDMVGNVWEWVAGEVREGEYAGVALPEEGYVAAVGVHGVPVATNALPQSMYNEDYFWSENEGVRRLMRGGFHGSRGDAGVYSMHAGVDSSFESAAVGFRCVKTLR